MAILTGLSVGSSHHLESPNCCSSFPRDRCPRSMARNHRDHYQYSNSVPQSLARPPRQGGSANVTVFIRAQLHSHLRNERICAFAIPRVTEAFECCRFNVLRQLTAESARYKESEKMKRFHTHIDIAFHFQRLISSELAAARYLSTCRTCQ